MFENSENLKSEGVSRTVKNPTSGYCYNLNGFNDLEMFDLVGFAVAMGDAQPALIERADFVTGTIEERGIQSVLERLALKVTS